MATMPPTPRMPDGFRKRGAEVTRLQAFVDAAFAFAVTLLVVSVDAIPQTQAEMLVALKGIPAFAVSFALVAVFWYGHASWTRRYGLDDMPSTLLSLTLVFLVLVLVYPLKIMFACFFSLATGGWLPANYDLAMFSGRDWAGLFALFGIAFASMGVVLALLTRHAWRRREALGLDLEERVATRCYELSWWLVPLVSALSIGLALLALALPGVPWLLALPGPAYMLLAAQSPLLAAYAKRERRRLAQDAAG